MGVKMKPTIKFFDIKLLLTSLIAFILIVLISRFIALDWTLKILGGALVYFLGIGKQLLPEILEKQINAKCEKIPEENITQINFRLNQIEKRLDKLSQTIFKVEAAVSVSPLDEFLEAERLNTKAISDLRLSIADLRSQIEKTDRIE